MNRKATALLMAPLLFLAACGGQKPKPPGGNGWQEGPIALTAAPELDLGTCTGVSGAKTQEWDANSGLPDRPEDTLILLAAGHGPNGKRPPYATCYDTNGNEQPLPTVAGKNEIQEDELTMALTLRLEAVLKRLGFPVELIRYGDYGTEGDCAQKALFRKSPLLQSSNSNALFCDWRYLSVRGRSDVYKLSSIKRLCANDPACINDVLIAGTKHAISRAGQIVRDHAARLKIAYDPAGENYVNSPKVAYLSVHFNSVAAAGDGVGTMLAMFSGTVRHQKSGYRPNPALTFQGPNHAPLGSVAKNYVTSVFEYMFHSLRESGALPETRGKRVLVYQNVDLVNPSHRAQPATPYSFKSDSRQGPLNDPGNPVRFNVNPPNPGVTGPVTVVSGLDSFYSNAPKKSYRALPEIISIPNNVTLEVAHYRDCRNAVPLLQSLQRPIMNPDFDADTSPLNPTDPLDVAAEDIAHGLVEYYESYVPGFKQKACDNLRASDWAAQSWQLPDWCGSTAGGGDNGTADIDNISPSSIEVTAWANIPSASSGSISLGFSNAGDADLVATISTSSPVAGVGPPNVYPAGTAAPSSAAQNVILPPGKTAAIAITYECNRIGEFSDPVVIRSNDPDESLVEIPMTVHCKSVPLIYLYGYDEAKGKFYEADDEGNEFYIDEYTAMNYYADAESGWTELAAPKPSIMIIASHYAETPITVSIETPEWLALSPNYFTLQKGDYIALSSLSTQGSCYEAVEKSGELVIRTSDPAKPIMKVPVRLMCGKLEIEFNPTVYNDEIDDLPKWCDYLRGSIQVYGADHLRELYVNIIYDLDENGNNIPVGVEYLEPRLSYNFKKGDWKSLRWPQVVGGWSWDDFPEVPFTSWTSSCVFDIGNYSIEDFHLEPFTQPDAGEVEIANNQFPGVVYNIAELCNEGNCVPLEAKHRIEENEHPDFSVFLDHNEWAWSAHSFATGYKYFVDHLLNGSVIASNESGMLNLYDHEKIIYCTGFAKLGPHSMRKVGGEYVFLSDMPKNVFWSHVIEYIDKVSFVTETFAGAWCYQPWDEQNSSEGVATTQSSTVAIPPWERGEKPQWTTINKLIQSTRKFKLNVTEPSESSR